MESQSNKEWRNRLLEGSHPPRSRCSSGGLLAVLADPALLAGFARHPSSLCHHQQQQQQQQQQLKTWLHGILQPPREIHTNNNGNKARAFSRNL